MSGLRPIEVDIDGELTHLPELVGSMSPDLLLLNDDALTYAKIRFDDRSLATLLDRIGELRDPLTRTLGWTAVWDMVRNAELPASDFVAMVLGGIGGETDIGAVESLHGQLIEAVERFVASPNADAAAARIATAATSHMHAADPGSDAQLAWTRLLARLSRSPEHLDFVAALRDGSVTVPGLVIDTELSWMLLAALARFGRADVDAIAAAVAADPTTSGRQYAAGAHAARPLATAKREAWAAIVDHDDLPNGVQSQIVGGDYSRIGVGFQQPTQIELLADYVEPYFAAVGHLWADRPIETARKLVGGLYPRAVVAESTVAATDSYLASSTVPPALRRLLVEGRDDVVRDLRARSVDAARG